MTQIRYVQGDATRPQGEGCKIIAHICNDRGGWGKGFVVALSKRWPEPERGYRRWYRNGRAEEEFGLGSIQLVQVEPDTWVANMVGQHGTRTTRSTGVPIRYPAVQQCLNRLAVRAGDLEASVHMPRIGCGLAGGEWERIEPPITGLLTERGVAVTVYDVP